MNSKRGSGLEGRGGGVRLPLLPIHNLTPTRSQHLIASCGGGGEQRRHGGGREGSQEGKWEDKREATREECVSGGGRRDGAGETDRQRQTNRQTQTDVRRSTETVIEVKIETNREREGKSDRQTDKRIKGKRERVKRKVFWL